MPTSGPIRSQIGPVIYRLNNHTNTAKGMINEEFTKEMGEKMKAQKSLLEKTIARFDGLNNAWAEYMNSLDRETLSQEEELYNKFPLGPTAF